MVLARIGAIDLSKYLQNLHSPPGRFVLEELYGGNGAVNDDGKDTDEDKEDHEEDEAAPGGNSPQANLLREGWLSYLVKLLMTI